MPLTIKQPRWIRIINFPAVITTQGHSYMAVRSVDTGANIILLSTLDVSRAGMEITIKDELGNATEANYIELQGEGGATIDGQTSAFIRCRYGSLRLVSDGTNWGVIDETHPSAILSAFSPEATQPVGASGSRKWMSFGASQLGSNDPMQLITTGSVPNLISTVRFNKGGPYEIFVAANVATTASSEAFYSAPVLNNVSMPNLLESLVVSNLLGMRLTHFIENNFDDGDELAFQMTSQSLPDDIVLSQIPAPPVLGSPAFSSSPSAYILVRGL